MFAPRRCGPSTHNDHLFSVVVSSPGVVLGADLEAIIWVGVGISVTAGACVGGIIQDGVNTWFDLGTFPVIV